MHAILHAELPEVGLLRQQAAETKLLICTILTVANVSQAYSLQTHMQVNYL